MRSIILLISQLMCLAALANEPFKIDIFPADESLFDGENGIVQDGVNNYPVKRECSRFSLENVIKTQSH